MAKKDNPFQTRKVPWKKDLKMNWGVYLMFIPIFLYTLVLHYIPMFGIVMAFEDYDINKGYFKSPWAAIDGATRLQRLTKITLPCIMPTIVMMGKIPMGRGRRKRKKGTSPAELIPG